MTFNYRELLSISRILRNRLYDCNETFPLLLFFVFFFQKDQVELSNQSLQRNIKMPEPMNCKYTIYFPFLDFTTI